MTRLHKWKFREQISDCKVLCKVIPKNDERLVLEFFLLISFAINRATCLNSYHRMILFRLLPDLHTNAFNT